MARCIFAMIRVFTLWSNLLLLLLLDQYNILVIAIKNCLICFALMIQLLLVSLIYRLIGQRCKMYSSKNDLPSVSRLNTVHYSGVPVDKCHEHFVFVSESTELVMSYNGDFIISARGFFSDKWHSSWYEVYRSPFIREILPIWYESVCFACLCQNMRHGFDKEF